MKMKMTSMKRAFILFWYGLTALLSGIADWFTVILGMRDESKYGRFLRRIVGSCFALLMVLLVIAASWDFCRTASNRLSLDEQFDDSYYNQRYISRRVMYYSRNGEDGYVMTADGKKTITGIQWIAKPLGQDSLVCYSDGKKRGYFNMFTGEPAFATKYDHAWIFSDGLASVDDGGWIKFIDATGKVMIDLRTPYITGVDGYVFHNNYCVMNNDRRDRFGMIDKHGKWVLKPEYFSIYSYGEYWVVDNGIGKSVLDSTLNTVIPFIKGKIWVSGKYISVTLDNHVIQRYSFEGELINGFYINDVVFLTYGSDELQYSASEDNGDEGAELKPVEKMAKCRRYETETGWYGLMAADGKVITPPSYISIRAIGYDIYLCKDNDGEGVILNGKGEMVN